ncbi:MAG: aminopeptidase P N-terminal domain-containing protein [Gemmatimonadota bacterium]|nr:aminopeptidase P N-terminal domain-containing protein [Gemmatimonadota bacterium]
MSQFPTQGVPAPETWRRRREAVQARMGASVMLLPAAPVQFRSRDTERRYRPDSELYYLTGVTEPGSFAVLVGGVNARLVLFVRRRDEKEELWAGPRLGPEGAAELFGADECYSVAELEERLPALLQEGDRINYRLGANERADGFARLALRRARASGAREGTGPRVLVDPGEVLDDMRLLKDGDEIAMIRAAAEVSAMGHRSGAAAIASGVGELVVESAVEAEFRALGAAGPGFATIVGSGANGCVLHYVENRDTVPDDALVLIDAGAEVCMYNGDITRTYPASGRFSDEQREVYRVVESARQAAVAQVSPGVSIASVHDASVRAIVEGLVGLGVLSGATEDLLADGAHRPFFPHQTSHWLGLDVHDPGDYSRDGASRVLEPGMVFTVEPGLYFRPDVSEGAGRAFSGIGVRIEDDVLVTAAGCEVLTASLPTSEDDIEGLVGMR